MSVSSSSSLHPSPLHYSSPLLWAVTQMKGSVSLPRRERGGEVERQRKRLEERERDHPACPYHFHLTARFHLQFLAFCSAPSTFLRIHVLLWLRIQTQLFHFHLLSSLDSFESFILTFCLVSFLFSFCSLVHFRLCSPNFICLLTSTVVVQIQIFCLWQVLQLNKIGAHLAVTSHSVQKHVTNETRCRLWLDFLQAKYLVVLVTKSLRVQPIIVHLPLPDMLFCVKECKSFSVQRTWLETGGHQILHQETLPAALVSKLLWSWKHNKLTKGMMSKLLCEIMDNPYFPWSLIQSFTKYFS